MVVIQMLFTTKLISIKIYIMDSMIMEFLMAKESTYMLLKVIRISIIFILVDSKTGSIMGSENFADQLIPEKLSIFIKGSGKMVKDNHRVVNTIKTAHIIKDNGLTIYFRDKVNCLLLGHIIRECGVRES